MNQEKAIAYLEKFVNKTLSAAEEAELHNWILSADRRSIEAVMEEYETTVMNAVTGEADPLLLQQIKERIAQKEREEDGSFEDTKVRRLFPWKRVAAAAVILLLLSVGGYFYFNNSEKQIAKTETQQQRFKNDVTAPGRANATVTLIDGKTVALDSFANGTLATQGNVRVIKTADGKIIYQPSSNGSQTTLQYNTLSNPKGSKVIDMTLGDGSRVWLNAGSSVTYPVAFSGNERKVKITGEAYFEVAHNAAMPFKIQKGEAEVTVLGTHFNINAYDDEDAIRVTLLEGSVKTSIGNGQSATLIPGQQAQITSDIKVVNNIDIEQVMGWKNGKFVFGESMGLTEIMRQVSRWYDVDIEYNTNINQSFGGSISREVNVSKVLEKFELTGRVHFVIEGRKVTVSN